MLADPQDQLYVVNVKVMRYLISKRVCYMCIVTQHVKWERIKVEGYIHDQKTNTPANVARMSKDKHGLSFWPSRCFTLASAHP